MSFYSSGRCEHCGAIAPMSNAKPLTERQRAIVDFIADHIHEYGFAPSFEEIAAKFGYRSLATVHEHLTNLERKGWLRRRYNESRSIQLLEGAA